MKVQIVKGKNYKNYIKIVKLNSLDELNALRTVVTRQKYLPFIKSFNKLVTSSYLIDETYVPLQFLQEIQHKFKGLYKFEIINPEILKEIFDLELKYDDLLRFISEINIPPKYDLISDKYKYQPESAFNALKLKTARIKIGTGGGKTLITYIYTRYLLQHKIENKILIIVPRKDLVIQTVKAFEDFNKLNTEKLLISTVYSNSKRIAEAQIVIGTYQSLSNYNEDYFDDFDALIIDEAQSAKIYSIKTEIYSKCKNLQYVFGMTATYPRPNTIEYLDIVAMLGPLVKEKTLRQLIDDGNISDILINRLIIQYQDDNIKYFTKQLRQENDSLDDVDKLTGSDIHRATKSFIQNLEIRNNLIARIIKNLKHNHLILVENIDYVDSLFSLFYMDFPDKHIYTITGKTPTKERQEIFQKLEESNNNVLVATYETMAVGVSINNIHYVHFPDGGKSMFRVLQGIGRGTRLHDEKDKLNVFDYVDRIVGSSLVTHANERLKLYKEEQLNIVETKIKI